MDGLDDSLLTKIGKGDENAFKKLFGLYRDRVFNYTMKITKSREASEEIVMDVFLKLWEGRSLLSEIESFPAFIFTVTKNKSIDFLRRAATDRVLKELVWDEIQVASGSASDDKIISEELEREMQTTIAKLSPQRQLVFRLSREEHMTYDQIAAHLHLSKSTVKNHMLDALRFIRSGLGIHERIIIITVMMVEKYFTVH